MKVWKHRKGKSTSKKPSTQVYTDNVLCVNKFEGLLEYIETEQIIEDSQGEVEYNKQGKSSHKGTIKENKG